MPLLYNALASGEMLPTVEMRWYRTSVEGKQEHFFTTKLDDATIIEIDCKCHTARMSQNLSSLSW